MLAQIFQSTLPARGATLSRAFRRAHIVISIHAPRTGSDGGHRDGAAARPHFNPRSPHGERLLRRTLRQHRAAFQSTLPARGATFFPPGVARLDLDFNPRSPHGERRESHTRHATRMDFNPRSPHGERRQKPPEMRIRQSFQSTLPARGATEYACFGGVFCLFQSTLPARGATLTVFFPT